MKVKVPQTIPVGSWLFKIVLAPELLLNHSLLGQCLTDRQTIKIDATTTEQTKNQALWHEAFHAINDVYHCGLNEENIDRLGHGVLTILNHMGVELDWSDLSE